MKIIENIPYTKKYENHTQGDLYLPEKTEENTPLVLCIHGGGWGALDKSRMKDISEFVCRKNHAVVYNINYRLCGEFKWPAVMEDCLEAARFLLYGDLPIPRSNKGAGKQKLFTLGGSAGGHLALMTGLLLPPEEVSGMISISGINSVEEDYAVAPKRYQNLFGHDPVQEELDSADPVKFLTPHTPPVLCTHDKRDNVVSFQCTERFISEAEKKGVCASSYLYCKEEEGFSHRIFIPGTTKLYADLEEVISKWIKKYSERKA